MDRTEGCLRDGQTRDPHVSDNEVMDSVIDTNREVSSDKCCTDRTEGCLRGGPKSVHTSGQSVIEEKTNEDMNEVKKYYHSI